MAELEQAAPSPAQEAPAPVQETAPAAAPQETPQTAPQPEAVQEPQAKEPQAKEQPKQGVMDDLFSENTEAGKEQPVQLPEKYEFTDADGNAVEGEIGEDYSMMAREMGLTQEGAQKFYASTQSFLKNRIARTNEIWSEQVQNDTEIGGERLPQTRANVKAAIDRFGTPELRSLIRQIGLSNNPEFVRFFSRVGASLSQDTEFVNGQGTKSQKRDPYAYMSNSPDLM